VGVVQGSQTEDLCYASTQNTPLPASQLHRLLGHGIANRLSSNIRDFVTFSGATQQTKNSDTKPQFRLSAILSSIPHIKAVF